MTTKFGDISNTTGHYLQGKMLKYAELELLFTLFGQSAELPENQGDTVDFMRPIKFQPATTPLVEGIDPQGSELRYETVSMKVDEFGDVTKVTNKAQMLAKTPEKALATTTRVQGTQIGETLEDVLYGRLKAGINVSYDLIAHTLRSQVNTAITKSRLQGVVATLRRNGSKPVTQMLKPGVEYGTSGIEAAYIAATHSDLDGDIRALDGFVPTSKYGSRKTIHPYEIGTVENVRFITHPRVVPFSGAGAAVGSTGLRSTGGNIDVYPILVFGEDWYGKLAPKGQNMPTPKVILPSSLDSGNPLGRHGSAGWSCFYTGGILNELFGVRFEVGCTNR